MSDATGRNVGRPAARVAAGIFLTRILGFVRERVFASYFGSGREADAFRAALKIPNIIRNLLGEGTLSASFIPVYAALLERGEEHTAKKLAASVLNLVVMLAIGGAVAGAVFAPVITDIAAPGFDEATRDITVTLVRIMFPMAGIMIVSAWCLGVLNTHRRFFLSYSAPMMWNVAQIVTLVMFGSWFAGWRGVQLVTALAWGALAGSILQVAMQLPSALSLAGIVRDKTNEASREFQRVVRAW
ncbi:MAG: murein biosynthesis integral membrane protein MurJ, partial [Gemmatimonadota bacterium]|nr:murein biosynthesis integral membrane protein MurJ [Gemmatimonadota bacterium]